MAVLLAACSAETPVLRTPASTGDGDPYGELDQSRSKETESGAFTITYVPAPDPIPLNQLFVLHVTVAGGVTAPVLQAVEVNMPSHGHGMNTRPQIRSLGQREFQVEGMQFHMEGHWTLAVTASAGAVTDSARFHVVCCDE